MRHWTTKYQMRFFIAVLQLSIILCYDTLKILKSGLDRGPIIHRWKNLFKHRLDNKRSMMAKEIVKGYGSYLDEKDFIMIKSLANIRTSWMCRFRVIFSNYFKTQKRYEIAFVKVFAVLGWL